jgi:methanogen homocitrate synthase
MKESVAVSPYNLCSDVLKEIRFRDHISIYDTTLRDGEQMPGIAFKPSQKKDIALFMDSIKIPQIELGFPAVSKTEFQSIRSITRERPKAKTLALCRLLRPEVDLCVESGVDIILLFIAASELHMKYKLKKNEDELADVVEDIVSYAKDRGVLVSFSTEDTTRSRLEVVHRLNNIAIRSGAKRIGITDTLGCATPEAISYIVCEVRKNIPRGVQMGLHLHNDYGLALANAFAGLKSGADNVATTVCGIGERCGNVPLEEFLVALKVLYGKDLGVRLSGLTELANKVARSSKFKIPPNKPIVGCNAFAHESGIHVSAVLNNPRTYESISPEMVGNCRRLIMGKHSGRAIIEQRLAEKGLVLDPVVVSRILEKVKALGEEKGKVTDTEFWRIVEMVKE